MAIPVKGRRVKGGRGKREEAGMREEGGEEGGSGVRYLFKF